MAKQKNKSEEVWAEKEGFPRRKFKLMQLEAMGTDPGGKSYDGWKVVKEAPEPDEVKVAKKAAVKTEPKKAATKNDSDNGDIPEAKDAAEAGSDDPGSVGEDPAQGGEGN